jgi:hypothetical protein
VAGRKHFVFAIALLALGFAGVALAGITTGSSTRAGSTLVNVALLDGKLSVSATRLPAGKITLVAVNKGKMTHGLAIMGTGLSPKRTPTIGIGKTARLTVTLKAGMYHIWDPVRSSMSHAKMLTVKAASTSSSGTGSSGGGGVVTGSGGSGTGMTMTGTDTDMDGCGMVH